MKRVIFVLVVALSMVPLHAVPTRAGATGAVIFTITLTGPVDAGDVFGLQRSKDECCFIDSVVLVCGAPEGAPACAPGSYRVPLSMQSVGTRIDYALLRWDDGVRLGYQGSAPNDTFRDRS